MSRTELYLRQFISTFIFTEVLIVMATVTTDQNLEDVTYSANETITVDNAVLTINQTPSVKPGSIVCNRGQVYVENTSTTTPIVVDLYDQTGDFIIGSAGTLKVRGNWIEIGTGDGSADQEFSMIVDSVTIKYPALVAVETGNGTGVYLMAWDRHLNETNNHSSAIFDSTIEKGLCYEYDQANDKIIFKNYKPVSGAKILIPNIHFHSGSHQTSIGNRNRLGNGTNGIGGHLDFDICSWSNNWSFNNAINKMNSIIIKNTGFFARLQITGMQSQIELENVIAQSDPDGDTGGVTVSNITSGVKIRNCVFTGTDIAGHRPLYMISCDKMDVDGVLLVCMDDYMQDGLLFDGCYDGVFKNIDFLNCKFVLGGAGHSFQNCKFGLHGGTASSTPPAYWWVISRVKDCTFDNFGWMNGAVPSGANNLFAATIVGTINIIIKNCNIDANGNANTFVNITDAHNVLVKNCTIQNFNSPYVISLGSSTNAPTGLKVENCLIESSAGAYTRFGPLGYWRHVVVSQNYNIENKGPDWYPYNILQDDSDKDVGDLVVGKMYEDNTLGFFSIQNGTLGSNVYFNSSGRLYFEANGNQFTIANVDPIKGITSFQNEAPVTQGSGLSNATFEFRVANAGQGDWSSWSTLNGSNLSSALSGLSGFDSDDGFDMEIRVTATTTSTSRYLEYITMGINTDPAFVYPDGPFTVKVTAIDKTGTPIENSRVFLKTTGGKKILSGLTDSNGEISGEYFGTTPQAVTGWARKSSAPPFYKEGTLAGNITANGYDQLAILTSDE